MNVRFLLAALGTGLIFGVGLGVSGLANPDNVLQFLTLDSNWSPALLFTMGAGVLTTLIGFRWVQKRAPVLCDEAQIPTKTRIDGPLLLGAAIFGVGWGIAGFCPGPAIVGLSSGMQEPFIFIASLIAGSQIRRISS